SNNHYIIRFYLDFIRFTSLLFFFFFFTDPPPTKIYTLSLHDALPIYHYNAAIIPFVMLSAIHGTRRLILIWQSWRQEYPTHLHRSEEHTSELQSRGHLVCRLLLEKKKNTKLDSVTRNN